MFKRRRSADDSASEDAAAPEYASDSVESDLEPVGDDEVTEITDLDDADDADDAAAEPAASRTAPSGGPFDEADVDDDIERLDLGALRIAPAEGIEVRLEIDEQSGQVQALTLVHGESAMQVGAFAAPRTEGIWEEVRTEIAGSISAGGGTVDQVDGPFGPELRTKVQGQDEKGRTVTQPLRFIGVDGPRWFLRGLIQGAGVQDEAAAAPLVEAFGSLVVVRGNDPRAPHEPLPIHLPVEATADEDLEAAGHELNPFRRGPEITEIR